jgi:predicted GIY-YIG superfamily endonuclease
MNKTIVYILQSERNPSRRYTGITSDIERRLQWHNSGDNTSTADDRPWHLWVSFHFLNESTARRFERYLKSGSGREFAKRNFDVGES